MANKTGNFGFRAHLRNIGEVHKLLRRGPITAAAIAEKLGVHKRTVRRYLLFLREIGAPIKQVRESGRGLRIEGHWQFGYSLARFAHGTKKRRRPTKYSEEIIKKATALFSDGVSVRKISESLGAPTQTVTNWVAAAGLRRQPRISKAVEAEILELHATGQSTYAIGRTLGISQTAVNRRVRDSGLFRLPGKRSTVGVVADRQP